MYVSHMHLPRQPTEVPAVYVHEKYGMFCSVGFHTVSFICVYCTIQDILFSLSQVFHNTSYEYIWLFFYSGRLDTEESGKNHYLFKYMYIYEIWF